MRESYDRGLGVSFAVLRSQITALPCCLYEMRLIHSGSHQPYPGVRRWTASQLLDPTTVRFLRIRNREGFDIYFRPYAGADNAGYILLDLDRPAPGIRSSLRAQGHEPSVVVQTSPGRLQAWIRVSREPLPLSLATLIARRLARIYAADLASAEGRHLGRLAGFTNRKPQRRQSDGLPPWVKLTYARDCLARSGAALIELASTELPACAPDCDGPVPQHASSLVPNTDLDSTVLRTSYQACLNRLRVLGRYPSPDWSIADKWVAQELLRTGTPRAAVAAVLRHGSPGFPRRHGDPEDYLRRTLNCAERHIRSSPLPARTHSLD
jgi:RepB DNA-primase N-terminal domain/RepB DNA-primase C-terminal helical domain